MKTITLAILVVLLPAAAHAHNDGAALIPNKADRVKGKGMRNTGIVFSVIGIGLTISGLALVINGATYQCGNSINSSCRDGSAIEIAIGGGILGFGLGNLGVGVPLWAVGQHRINLSLAPTADRRGGAAQVAWRF